jgi:hypothetical protein
MFFSYQLYGRGRSTKILTVISLKVIVSEVCDRSRGLIEFIFNKESNYYANW